MPANAAQIAKILVNAGAVIDAKMAVYGGHFDTSALSHPQTYELSAVLQSN